jgi:hypothetical protein
VVREASSLFSGTLLAVDRWIGAHRLLMIAATSSLLALLYLRRRLAGRRSDLGDLIHLVEEPERAELPTDEVHSDT